MAKRKVRGADNATEGSYPAGNGGRVTFPVRRNRDGISEAIDPSYSTYSGMTKRQAISDGTFTPGLKNVPPDIPED